jgi:phosphoribosylglycinamide formyltransferase-1
VTRIVVMVSGQGTNLQAILDGCAAGALPAAVVLVVSNRPGVPALERAGVAGVPVSVVPRVPGEPRTHHDGRLARAVSAARPHWVVLAGYDRLLSRAFLDCFPDRVVNLHPALPGSFPGLHAVERAHAAFRRGEISRTGVMVHRVPDQGVDNGPVLATTEVPLVQGEGLEDLRARVHAAEHRLLVETLGQLCREST